MSKATAVQLSQRLLQHARGRLAAAGIEGVRFKASEPAPLEEDTSPVNSKDGKVGVLMRVES